MESLRPPLPKYSKPSSPTHIDHHQINKRSIVDGDEIFKIPDNRYSSISTITNESSFDQSMMRSESDVSIVWSNLTQKDTNKRLQIMTELVQTEIKYVSDLTFLKTVFKID
jgi:hypothetical protein